MPKFRLHDLVVFENRRRVISCALLILIGVICLTGCQPRRKPVAKNAGVKPPVQEQPAIEDNLKVELQKGRIIWDDAKGRRIFEAQYEEAIASQTGDTSTVELHGVKANLYKNGKITSSLDAPKIVTNSKTREIKATGGAKIVSATQNTSARADQLTWKSREDKVFGSGAVKMVKGNISITAGSFEADTAMKKARFRNAVMDMD